MAYVNTISVSSRATSFEHTQEIVSAITTFCLSAGWTCVESRLQAGNFEWTLLKSPSSYTGNSSFGYTLCFATWSSGGTFQNIPAWTMLTDWDAVNKRTLIYPASGNTTTTGSGTTTASYAYLPGSDSKMKQMWLINSANGPWYDFTNRDTVIGFYAKEASIAFNATRNDGGNIQRAAYFYAGEFDSFLSNDQIDFSANLFVSRTRSGSLIGEAWQEREFGVYLTDPGPSNSNWMCFSVDSKMNDTESRVDGAVVNYPNKGWSHLFKTDHYSNTIGVSRIPLFRTPAWSSATAMSNDKRSPRGVFKHFFFTSSIAPSQQVRWSYLGNSYSGTYLFNKDRTSSSTSMAYGVVGMD